MKKVVSILISIAFLALTACSTSQVAVMPQANNQYQLVSTASTSTDAINGAMDKANALCQKTNQKPIVVSSSINYQGMSQDAKQLAEMAASAINLNTTNYMPGPDTSEDYTANMTVQCQ